MSRNGLSDSQLRVSLYTRTRTRKDPNRVPFVHLFLLEPCARPLVGESQRVNEVGTLHVTGIGTKDTQNFTKNSRRKKYMIK